MESQKCPGVLTLENSKKAIVANETVKSKLYCANNVNKLKNEIPKQDWVLCMPSAVKEEIHRVRLTEANELQLENVFSIQEVIQKAPASDLKSIPEILIG